MITLIAILFCVVIAIGIWRRAGSIQWIWLLFGAAILMVVLFALLIVFVVAPEMRRMGPPG